ncbi:MAG: FkbM family methyltransferase [Clostridia bacterium]|nr:FkbM family methyltransferase [Clostridia bacterium]
MKNFAITVRNDEYLWEYLERSRRPVVLYGMGDGAVKLLSILESRGIKPVGIFASDEFVRYNEFCSYTVKKLSDLEAEFDDFIILVAFATHLDEVRERIFSIAQRHEVYVPDINVTGDALEVFDREFLNKYYTRLRDVYFALSDERSKKVFNALISFKLTGRLCYLEQLERLRRDETLPYDAYAVRSFADFGAYTGDTLAEAFEIYPNLEKAFAFEPDAKTFKKLEKNTAEMNVTLFQAVAWSESCELELLEGAGRNTVIRKRAFDNAEMQAKKIRTVTALRADSVAEFVPDLIKMDVEGCEREALEGCRGFFESATPIVRMSIYHNNRDLFELWEKLDGIKKGYKLALSQKCRYIPAWDVELVAYV